MALTFCESFDGYTAGVTSSTPNKWDVNFQVGHNSTFSASGRNGTQGWVVGDGGNYMTKFLPAQATWIVGFAYNPAGAFGPTALLRLIDNATVQIRVDVDTSGPGLIKVYRGEGSTLLGTTSAGMPLIGGFNYVEVKIKLHGSTGTVDVRINETNVLSLTAQNTIVSANASADRFSIGPKDVDIPGNGSAVGHIFDDIYVCDATGTTNNDFLGDCRIQAIPPSGDGNSSQWVGSDGNSVNNSLLVDEIGANGDTDYVASANSTDKDTYAFGDLTPTAGTVFGVQISLYARKDDAGTRQIKSVARAAATEADGPAQTLSTTYAYYNDVRETKPAGGAWAISDVNGAEFGVKVV